MGWGDMLKEGGMLGAGGTVEKIGGAIKKSMPLIGAGLWAAEKVMDAIQIKKNVNIKRTAQNSIEANFQNQLLDLTKQKEMKEDQIDTQYAAGSQQLNVKAGQSLEGLVKATQTAEDQGFETSEETTLDTSEIINQFNTQAKNLVDSRKMNLESNLFNINKEKERATDARDQQMAQTEQIQTKFGLADLLS